MQVKIDTKEKYHVITPKESQLSATMAEGMDVALLPYLKNNVKNVVLDMSEVNSIEKLAAERILQIQQLFYENNASFIMCNFSDDIEAFLADIELLELLNVTPTLSEAIDIVQMEEIERELFDEDILE